MTSISLPVPAQPQWMDSPHSRQSSATYLDNTRGHSARRSMVRPPNPSFSFPQAPPDDVQDEQQPRQMQRRALPLPAFSFPQFPESSSSSPLAETAATTQSRDPANNSLCPPAAVTPLTTSSSLSTPPPGLVSNPGQGRSRHRHRRSAAISSVDMTAVAKAFPPAPIGGSAPVTPKQQLAVDDTNIPTACSAPGPQRSPSLRLPPAKPADSPTRNEEIPVQQLPTRHRPLSTISSEGSVCTLRPTQPTVDSNRLNNTASTSSSNQATSRPKTAGAASALNLTSDTANKKPEQRRPVSASALVTLNADFSKMCSSKEPESNSDTPSSTSTHTLTSDVDQEEHTTEETSKGNSGRKSNKKPKKVRSWAGILTRKTKKRASKKSSKKAPTPPMLSRTNSEIGSMYGVNFDEDNTIVIRTPTNPDAPRRPLPQPSQNGNRTLSFESSWKPTSFYEQGSELDMASPVIDLDAALGPFNTPEMGSERPSASGFSVATRRMYSGGRRGEFVGPEMRYHRRTESAPEMPPFDRTALAIGRYGLCSAMANPDVFDEEEEDAFLAQNDKPALKGEKSAKPGTNNNDNSNSNSNNKVSAMKSSSGSDTASEAATESDAAGLGIQVVDSADLPVLDSSAPPSVESRPSTAQIITPRTPVPNIMEISESHRVAGFRDNVDIVDFDQWSAVHADKQGGLAQSSPRNYHQDAKRPATSPEYVYNPANQPSLSEIPPVPSGFPSPENSRTSFEGPRLMTASSSMTDRYAPNSLYNAGPDSEHYHGSVEDVPSLTSSASTMTGTMPRQSSTSHGITSFADRSASFSTALPRASNSAKRSSLVSLSKLVSASTGERSKLSYEEKAPRDEPEKKKKKGHRISRLMHFWKTKEKETQHSTTQ